MSESYQFLAPYYLNPKYAKKAIIIEGGVKITILESRFQMLKVCSDLGSFSLKRPPTQVLWQWYCYWWLMQCYDSWFRKDLWWQLEWEFLPLPLPLASSRCSDHNCLLLLFPGNNPPDSRTLVGSFPLGSTQALDNLEESRSSTPPPLQE